MTHLSADDVLACDPGATVTVRIKRRGKENLYVTGTVGERTSGSNSIGATYEISGADGEDYNLVITPSTGETSEGTLFKRDADVGRNESTRVHTRGSVGGITQV